MGLAAAPALAKDVKICLIAGKTGALEAYAKQTENGFLMGLEYLTQGSNKVGNDKLEVIVKDDQLKPDRGKSLLEECYGDDKADLAVGTTGSPVALAMLPVAEEHKKLLIVEPAVADSITGDKWTAISSARPQLLSGRAGRRRRLPEKRRGSPSACSASTRRLDATASLLSNRPLPASGRT
jgi:ABC-type branched-subunit amino acid transport system substrate-binding protein